MPYIDKMVTKSILHKNKAARVKSRLNAAVLAIKA
jgi:small subunit ribosomal protein S20